jgi:soluble lytic murein transglycosylase-like protein
MEKAAKSVSKTTIFALTPLILLVGAHLSVAQALDLKHTVWERVAAAHGLDPYLVYAVALMESRRTVGPNKTAPWPWALGTPSGAIYAKSRSEAIDVLGGGVRSGRCVDVGVMQISTCWHAGRVDDILDLLDPHTNIRIGAAILRESLDSVPTDPELGIGRYHSWSDETRARWYGRRVLGIRRNLLNLRAGPGTAP